MSVNVLPYGERAVLVETDDPHEVPALRAAAAARADVVEAVAGAQTVLIVFAGAVPSTLDLGGFAVADPPNPPRTVQLPVGYDGADLAEVAAEVGMTADEVVRRHTGVEYTVRFCGFSPGFAYLDGLDPRLHVPRHASPRTSVPAGSVGLAGEFTGVYPRSSPGGWRLIGRTATQLWDPTRDPPALLVPGARVRFVAS